MRNPFSRWLCPRASSTDPDVLRRLDTLEKDRKQMTDDIDGVKQAVAAEIAAAAALRAKYDAALAKIQAELGNLPPDNSAAISQIISDLQADTAANTGEPDLPADPAPAPVTTDPNAPAS